MQILFLGRNDWANVSHRVARGINQAVSRQVARVLVLEPHPYGYAEDMVIGSRRADGWREFGRAADWLISTGDGEYGAFHSLVEAVRVDQRVATAHVGSAYRSAPYDFNQADGAAGFDLRFIGGDLYRFCRHDPRAVPYFAPPGAFDTAGPITELGAKVRIGHSPSSREKKGTAQILEVLEDLKSGSLRSAVEIDIIEGVSFDVAEYRRRLCHIFIDQMVPWIGGYGASAVEALAAGCAVLADVRNVHPDVNRFYPPPPIIGVHDRGELGRALVDLIRDRGALEQLRQESRSWAAAHASPPAVGRYWLGHLYPGRPL